MTPKQERFVAAYEGNATEAALKAGYSKKTAYAQGQRLLKNVEIADAIRQREKKNIDKVIAPRLERQSFWTATMRDEGAEMKDRLKASELLGKSEGDFLDRTEITGDKGGPIVYRWDV